MTKFIFGMQINIEVSYKLILSIGMCVTRHAQKTQNEKFAYICNISRKAKWIKMIFCLQVNTKFFYKMIVLLWVCVARHAQSIEHNKFVTSLQYLRENMKDEVDFLPADKRESFPLIDTIILGVCGQVCPNFPK